MTHPKRNTMINRTALLLSLFIVHGVAFAAPPSKNNDDIKISTDRGQISLDWDDRVRLVAEQLPEYQHPQQQYQTQL